MVAIGRHGQQSEAFFKSRVHRAELLSVDAENGTAVVQVEGMLTKFSDVPLPMGLTVKNAQSSWLRYMPDGRDFCEVAFNTRNQPRIVALVPASYAETTALADKPEGDTGRLIGWKALLRGEVDARSRGGASWRLTQDGRAVIAAGAVGLTLDKNRAEVTLESADHVRVTGSGMELRFGQIHRTPVGGFVERDVASDPTLILAGASAAAFSGAPREMRIRVGQAYDPISPFGTPRVVLGVVTTGYPALYESWVGDLRNAAGVAELGGYAVGLRGRWRTYLADGATTAVEMDTDALGNTRVTIGATAGLGGLAVTSPSVAINATGIPGTAALSGTTSATLSSDALARVSAPIVELAAPLVRIGGSTAIHMAARGDNLALLLGAIADAAFSVTAGGPLIALNAIGTAIATALGQAPGTPSSLVTRGVLLV